MIKRIKRMDIGSMRERRTEYEYEITKEGKWKCLRCGAEMKYRDEVEEHHNAHTGEE